MTTFSYDGLGRLWKRVSPDTGTTTFAYDAYGRLASTHTANGVTSAYSYDSLNRLTKVAAGGQSRTFVWDNCPDGKGRLCTAATAASSVDYDYTPEGWVAARGFSFADGTTYTFGFGYDGMGHMTGIAYPDGNQVTYDYSRGVVSAVHIKIGSGTHSVASGIGYRPMDLAMSTWKSFSGVVSTIAYDSDMRPTSITATGAESLAFTYDAANRMTRLTNGLDSAMTETLGYDALGRLTSVSSGAQTASYTYDADGNRTHQVLDGVATSFAYASGSNRLASAAGGLSASYGYDADGNTVTVDGHAVYTYDPFGQLEGADGAVFVVDAEGQRLHKQLGGSESYYAPGPGGTVLAQTQYDAWSDYVWLNGRVVARTRKGHLYPIYGDQTSRPLVLTNYSKSVDWAGRGYPFNRKLTTNAGVANVDLGFPGQWWDSEDGLWHNGARDYDPDTGRYIESDPIGLGGGVNTYAYVGNNPINRIDTQGLCDRQKCTAARALVASLGQSLSSAGNAFTWSGIGAVGISAAGAIFAPEGAPAELEGGEAGVGLIEIGSAASSVGNGLVAYSRYNVFSGVAVSVMGLTVDRFNSRLLALRFPGSDVGTKTLSAILGQIPEALQKEQVECTNGQ